MQLCNKLTESVINIRCHLSRCRFHNDDNLLCANLKSTNVLSRCVLMVTLLSISDKFKNHFFAKTFELWQHSWWRLQMATFSALLTICAGNSPVTGEFPAQRPLRGSFGVSLICAWINSWINNREAGDLRRHRAHYDATVMFCGSLASWGPVHNETTSVVPSTKTCGSI